MSPVMDFMSGAIKDRKKAATKEEEEKTVTDKGGKPKGQKESQKLYDKVHIYLHYIVITHILIQVSLVITAIIEF